MLKRLLFYSLIVLAACNDQDIENDTLNQVTFRGLTDSISKAPDDAGLYYRRGIALYANDQKELAIRDLRRAWSLAPLETHGLSLTTALKEKSTDSAIIFLEDAILKLPESIALKIGLARGYQQKGRNDKALDLLNDIIKTYPGQLDALAMKSEILKDMNQPDESLAFLERAQSLVPSDPELAYNLAYEYAIAKNAKVIRLTDSLIRAGSPEIEKAYYSKGIYFSHTGRYQEALQNFDAATKSNYNFIDAYHDKGELLFSRKNYDEAQKTFELALKIAPANALFYYWLGKCQQARGYKDEAKANYLRAFGLDKSMREAKEAADRL